MDFHIRKTVHARQGYNVVKRSIRRSGRAAAIGLDWRDVGPMRGGRSYAVSGNAAEPDTFYMGSVGGGLWKTVDAGRTWQSIADDPARYRSPSSANCASSASTRSDSLAIPRYAAIVGP